MADVEVTPDDERAAGVPKVERSNYEDTVAADAAKSIAEPGPKDAEANALALAEARAEEEKAAPKVKIKISDSFVFPEGVTEVVCNHPSGQFKISKGKEVEVKRSVFDSLGEDNGVVEVSE